MAVKWMTDKEAADFELDWLLLTGTIRSQGHMRVPKGTKARWRKELRQYQKDNPGYIRITQRGW